MSDWDRADTVAQWLSFGQRFDRYHVVNAALAEHARLGSARTVLDVGAGTGGTIRALLPLLAQDARALCVEPADAMRSAAAVADPRVRWAAELPDRRFDRVVCGASMWLMGPLAEAAARLRAHLEPGGALIFAIPSSYLGQPDPPGGGPDPWLVEPAQRFVAERTSAPPAGEAPPGPDALDEALRSVGLRPERWSVQTRWTTASTLAWLRLPPVAASMRPDLGPRDRQLLLDEIEAACPPDSWRTEAWFGWTAWA